MAVDREYWLESKVGRTVFNTQTAGDVEYVDITMLDNGNFAIIYNGTSSNMHVDLFDGDGNLIAGNILPESHSQTDPPQIEQTAPGDILVIWKDADPATGNSVSGAILNGATGTQIGSTFEIESSSYTLLGAGTAGNGNTMVVSKFGQGHHIRIIDPDGNSIGQSTADGNSLTRENNYVAGLEGGGFVYVYDQEDSSGVREVIVKTYDAFGSRISTDTISPPADEEFTNPRVTGEPGGGFVVSWQVAGPEPDIDGRRYDGLGNEVNSGRLSYVFSTTQETNGFLAPLADGAVLTGYEYSTSLYVNVLAPDQFSRAIDGSAAPSGFFIPTVPNDFAGSANASNYLATAFIHPDDGDGTGVGVAVDEVYLKVIGDTQDDLLEASQLRDEINGGFGVNTVSYSFATEGVTINLLNGEGSRGDAEGDSYLFVNHAIGGAGDDQLRGDGEDNTLEGGAGADQIAGQGGNDTASYANASAAITLDLQNTGNSTGDAAGDTFNSIEIFEGSEHDDTLLGNGSANTLMGGDGGDSINGRGGADTMIGGDGNDIYTIDDLGDVVTEMEGEGDDIAYVGLSMTIPDNVEVMIALAGAGNLDLTGGAERDILQGNEGVNIIDGAGGVDVMQGGAGDDVYAVDDSSDAVIEAAGEGFDNVYSSVDYIIDAAQEIESAILTGSATVLRGDDSNNQLFGNENINVLEGKGGTDYLLGLGGDDIFQVSLEASAADLDVFGDFEGAGVVGGDRIALDASIWGSDGIVYQVSQTSFIVATAQNTNQQQFIIANLTDPTTTLIAGDDYYFG